jgi:hypothetical protein
MAQLEHILEPTYSDFATISANRRRISWGAILAGSVAAISVQLLLTLLGISIGAWVADPAAGREGMQGIGIGAGIWALATFIIALFCGGWIAGRMAGVSNKLDGMLEGFLVWSAVTALSFMLLTSTIGGILGGAAGLAGNLLSAAPEVIENPQQAIRDLGVTARQATQGAESGAQAEAATVDSSSVAKNTAAGSFWAFLALLLGALVASLAGRMGGSSGLRDAGVLPRETVK